MPAYSVRHLQPPPTSWWATPMSRSEWTARQHRAQRRMSATGKDLMPYGWQQRTNQQLRASVMRSTDEPREVFVQADVAHARES